MTQQTINVGTVANDGTGDPVRSALTKANANFVELYSGVAAAYPASNPSAFITSAALAGYAQGSSVTTAIAAAVAGLSVVARSGAYADLTGAPASYALPIATGSALGGVKAGSGVTIAGDGTLAVVAAPVQTVAGRTGSVVLVVADVAGAQSASQVAAAVSAGTASNTASIAANTSNIATNTSSIAAHTTTLAGLPATYAPLVSPALTGSPTAPTATFGTNNTQLATTAFVLANSAVYTLPTASTTVLGGVKVDGTTVTISAGVISAASGSASTAFARTAYTASGAISTANTLAILNGASGTLAMTLANGTVDGQPLLIKLLGAANATVTAVIDGTSQTVAMTASAAGTIRDTFEIKWSAGDTSWLAE